MVARPAEVLGSSANKLEALRFDNSYVRLSCATILRKTRSRKLRKTSPHFSPRSEMIAQRFDFTRHFLKERNTG
ncbi:MAG: hypothetical protein ACR2RB_01190, partial [Gammaproteobacteria bacterium]